MGVVACGAQYAGSAADDDHVARRHFAGVAHTPLRLPPLAAPSLGTLQTLPSADVGGLGGGEGDADASPGGAIASSAVPTNDVP